MSLRKHRRIWHQKGPSDITCASQAEYPPRVRVANEQVIFGFRDGTYLSRQINIAYDIQIQKLVGLVLQVSPRRQRPLLNENVALV